MNEKQLGKISSAKFGVIGDYPFLWGMLLCFSGDGWGIADGGKYTLNMSESCNWKRSDYLEALEKINRLAFNTINDAKVNSVEELKGIPVEIEIDDKRSFVGFRILKEVL